MEGSEGIERGENHYMMETYLLITMTIHSFIPCFAEVGFGFIELRCRVAGLEVFRLGMEAGRSGPTALSSKADPP